MTDSAVPTAPNSKRIARAVLLEKDAEKVVLTFKGHSTGQIQKPTHQMHLTVASPVDTEPGKRILGTIRVEARRLDICGTGGSYVEPVYGRPRRIQGTIIDIDSANASVVVDAGMPIVAKLDGLQRTSDFKLGDHVTFAVKPGATFEPAN
ncbi:MAG: hypothetical protein ACIAQF_08610 [Phycisphaerales bacterium JB065]